MTSHFQTHLTRLLDSLPASPSQEKLNALVKKTLSDTQAKSSPENRKSQWEYLLKNAVLDLACTEGRALKDENTKYYDRLRDLLDVVLTFTEHEACEQTLPFTVLQDLLETQTIASCSHIFSWIEERAARLTEGLVPQKGKALVLLRTLNDLLRRLSKMGSTTIFCGRILTFLSGVFPLGERSGVNLRGEYGPTWEGVHVSKTPPPAAEEQDVVMAGDADVKPEDREEDKMQVDEPKKEAEPAAVEDTKEDFYNTFWSLQLPFSKPPLFALPDTFNEFKDAVNKVLPVIKEATAKERAMMGSRAGGSVSLKRKRDPDTEESNTVTEYFFAKFLTSPDLLDLEIADTHFRRQFLFQLAILLTHLQTFTKASKSAWATARNRSLQIDFTLEVPAQAEWVAETLAKTMDELKQTAPNGRAFAETVSTILEREKNWVRWKNELCTAFDKEPWSAEINGKKVGLEEATREARQNMRKPPEEWAHRLGSAALTEIWDMGYRDLKGLQPNYRVSDQDIKDSVKELKAVDAKIELRRKRLALVAERAAAAQAKLKPPPAAAESEEQQPTPTAPKDKEESATTVPAPPAANNSPIHPSLPAKPGSETPAVPASAEREREATPTAVPVIQAPVPPPPLTDDQIISLEESKHRIAWLALRAARDVHLQHFGKIGTGDIELLAKEIEAEKRNPKADSESGGGGASAEDAGGASPTLTASSKVLSVAGEESGKDAGKVAVAVTDVHMD